MKTSQETSLNIARLRSELLGWYDEAGRTLPWRIRPEDRESGAEADPYKIWLSEIMCQQTSVTAAGPYWHKFLKKWPQVTTLASAPRDDVLSAWAGLGYYARARNLHACANIIANKHNGVFPRGEENLLKLPGIGPYTAAAIASICWDEATNVVDGNVERVIARMFRVEEALPKSRRQIKTLAGEVADPIRPGDYGQALMDLGSQVCKPKNPKCGACPWRFACKAYAGDCAQNYPVKGNKKARPVRYGAVFYLENSGKTLLRRRPDKGLLGGMMELPGTEWTAKKRPIDSLIKQAPEQRNWRKIEPDISHVFTHFALTLAVFTAEGGDTLTGIWADLGSLDDYALPSLMRKAIAAALTNKSE